MLKYIKAHGVFLLKLLVFLVLLTAFLVSNFKPQLDKYLQGSTTFSTRFETITEYQAPLIIFCTHPGTKSGISRKYQYDPLPNSIFYDVTDKYKNYGLNLWEMYNELMYQINEDFELSIDMNRQGKYVKLDEDKVNYWNENYSFEVFGISTFHRGICYGIHPKFKMTLEDRISLKINFLTSEIIPEKLTLLIGSIDTWYGVYVDDWPYFNLAELRVDLDPTKIMQSIQKWN